MIVNTHQLRSGDMISLHGMEILITGAGIETSHPLTEASPTLYWDGEITNIEEVRAANYIPPSFIKGARWTVQGNGLAIWRVTRVSVQELTKRLGQTPDKMRGVASWAGADGMDHMWTEGEALELIDLWHGSLYGPTFDTD